MSDLIAAAPLAAPSSTSRLEVLAACDLEAGGQPDEAAAVIVATADEFFGADAGTAVILWDVPEAGGRIAGCSLACEGEHVASSAPVRRVMESGEPWLGNGAFAGQAGVVAGSVAAMPLRADRVHGVLLVARQDAIPFDEDRELLELFAERAASALSTAARLAQLEANRERFEVLAWVANALIAVEDLEDVLGAVVEGVAAALMADRVVLSTGRGDDIRPVVGGFGADDVSVMPEIFQTGIGLWVARSQRAVKLIGGQPDPREAGPSLRQALGCDLGPGVVAPIRIGSGLDGVLGAFRKQGDPEFEDAEVDLVLAVAGQAGAAIDHVRLVDERARSLLSTKTLYSVAQRLNAAETESEVLAAGAAGATQALSARHAAFTTVDVRARRLGEIEAAGSRASSAMTFDEIWESPAGRVLRTGSAVRDGHAPGGPWLAAPLQVHGRILGVCWARRSPGDRPFGEEEMRMLSSLASQAALSIDNLRHIDEVQHLADTDGLTGLFNRRAFVERSDLAFRTSIRLATDVSVLLFDVDHFKAVNDTHGHAVGDEVLRVIASAARGAVRDVDVLGRYGGEEFAVVLPAAGEDDAVMVAERIRTSVAAEEIPTATGPVSVRVSVGVATRTDEDSLVALLDRADAALYRAKDAGRDRVEIG